MSFPPSPSFIFHHQDDQQQQHHHNPVRTTPFPSFPTHQQQHHHFPGPWMKRSMSFSAIDTTKNCAGGGADELVLHGEDELSDDGSQIGEKKKRLGMEQVKALEKSFEAGNKLDPERKMQLAKALGLQPRQIAIWFQNRRARWKTKQLEKEYEVLKKQFDAVKADNDSLRTQNQKLHAELQALKGNNREWCETGTVITLKKENEGSWSNNGSDNSSDMNLDLSRTPVMNSPVSSSHHHHQNNNNNNNNNNNDNNNNSKNLVLPNSLIKPTSITQLLQCSSSSTRSDLHQDDQGFCNMFHNIDEQQQNFWSWPTENNNNHHHFH